MAKVAKVVVLEVARMVALVVVAVVVAALVVVVAERGTHALAIGYALLVVPMSSHLRSVVSSAAPQNQAVASMPVVLPMALALAHMAVEFVPVVVLMAVSLPMVAVFLHTGVGKGPLPMALQHMVV